MAEFVRPHHRRIARFLGALDAGFLQRASCFFGGGTQIALAFGEYRESRDVDFLCASRAGFRAVRETVTQVSLGKLARRKIVLVREVRADRDGIRTAIEMDGMAIKFELILEARIDLTGGIDPRTGVPTLDVASCVAEKLLANADRGLDRATRARDLIDLAFVAAHHPLASIRPGVERAEGAYGLAVLRELGRGLDAFAEDRRYLLDCVASLGIEDAPTLRRGLTRLRRLCNGARS